MAAMYEEPMPRDPLIPRNSNTQNPKGDGARFGVCRWFGGIILRVKGRGLSFFGGSLSISIA